MDGDVSGMARLEEGAALAGLDEGDEETKEEGGQRGRGKKAKKALPKEVDAEAAEVWCCGRSWARRRLAWVVVGATLGVALLGGAIGLVTYLILLRTTEGPVLSIAKCVLVDLAFAGSAINAVIAIEGQVANRARYTIWIDSPDIKVS